jgi:hypothetical protein
MSVSISGYNLPLYQPIITRYGRIVNHKVLINKEKSPRGSVGDTTPARTCTRNICCFWQAVERMKKGDSRNCPPLPVSLPAVVVLVERA